MKLLIVDDDLNTVQVIRDSIEWDRLGFNDVLVAFGEDYLEGEAGCRFMRHRDALRFRARSSSVDPV